MALLELDDFGSQRRTFFLSETSVGFVIDCTMTQEHSINVQTTDHPVERGFAITDHRRVQPAVLKLTGLVSNYRVRIFASAGGATNYVANAWEIFKQLKASGELVKISTSLETYENMMITEVTVPRDAKRGNVLEFSVTAKELRIVDSQEVPAPTIEEPVQEQPKPPSKDLGLKTPTAPSAATLKSAAAQGLDKITGSFREILPF